MKNVEYVSFVCAFGYCERIGPTVNYHNGGGLFEKWPNSAFFLFWNGQTKAAATKRKTSLRPYLPFGLTKHRNSTAPLNRVILPLTHKYKFVGVFWNSICGWPFAKANYFGFFFRGFFPYANCVWCPGSGSLERSMRTAWCPWYENGGAPQYLISQHIYSHAHTHTHSL